MKTLAYTQGKGGIQSEDVECTIILENEEQAKVFNNLTINNMKVLHLTRKELKDKTRRDFEDGDVLKVGKYYIFIKGLNTYASTEDSMIPLKESKLPQYIHSIVF